LRDPVAEFCQLMPRRAPRDLHPLVPPLEGFHVFAWTCTSTISRAHAQASSDRHVFPWSDPSASDILLIFFCQTPLRDPSLCSHWFFVEGEIYPRRFSSSFFLIFLFHVGIPPLCGPGIFRGLGDRKRFICHFSHHLLPPF